MVSCVDETGTQALKPPDAPAGSPIRNWSSQDPNQHFDNGISDCDDLWAPEQPLYTWEQHALGFSWPQQRLLQPPASAIPGVCAPSPITSKPGPPLRDSPPSTPGRPATCLLRQTGKDRHCLCLVSCLRLEPGSCPLTACAWQAGCHAPGAGGKAAPLGGTDSLLPCKREELGMELASKCSPHTCRKPPPHHFLTKRLQVKGLNLQQAGGLPQG